MNKVEQNPDYMSKIKQALTNIATTGKLFDRVGVNTQLEMRINNGYKNTPRNLQV